MNNLSSKLTRLTPVLVVDEVETCIRFWIDQLGFKPGIQVPGDDGKFVFASVEKDGLEIMYQTKASVVTDRPQSADELGGHSIILYIEVENIDDVERALTGVPLVKPRHTTFYGSTEIYVREPGGNTIGFAMHSPQVA